MKPEMIDSQVAALGRPESDETDVLVPPCSNSVESVVESTIGWVQSTPAGMGTDADRVIPTLAHASMLRASGASEPIEAAKVGKA